MLFNLASTSIFFGNSLWQERIRSCPLDLKDIQMIWEGKTPYRRQKKTFRKPFRGELNRNGDQYESLFYSFGDFIWRRHVALPLIIILIFFGRDPWDVGSRFALLWVIQNFFVTAIAQWAKAPGTHCYVPGSILAVTPIIVLKNIPVFQVTWANGR